MRVMIPKRLAAAALPATILGVEKVVVAHAFRVVIRSEITDGRYFWRWDRDRGWAVDRVEAVYRVHSPHDLSINAGRLVAETESALPWFEQYATAENCLARLKSPDRNGVGIGKPVHAEAVARLEALRTGGPS